MSWHVVPLYKFGFKTPAETHDRRETSVAMHVAWVSAEGHYKLSVIQVALRDYYKGPIRDLHQPWPDIMLEHIARTGSRVRATWTQAWVYSAGSAVAFEAKRLNDAQFVIYQLTGELP